MIELPALEEAPSGCGGVGGLLLVGGPPESLSELDPPPLPEPPPEPAPVPVPLVPPRAYSEVTNS